MQNACCDNAVLSINFLVIGTEIMGLIFLVLDNIIMPLITLS